MKPSNGKQFHHMAGDGLNAPGGYTDYADMTDGADVTRAFNSPDIAYGYGGDDILGGGKAPDRLFGMDGDDFLHGGRGNDLLNGGAGNDRLRGGSGGDTLTGGDGADKFVYHHVHNSISGDHDTITDFQTGIDHVVLGKDLAGLAPSDIHIVQHGGDYVVTIDGSNFELVSKTAIAVTDFILH